MGKARYNRRLFDKARGIVLDVGCGLAKQKGAIGIDWAKIPGVDIVHDLSRFPWPVPSNICSRIIMSHVWEHIEPRHRNKTMDECWRIIRHDGQLFIAAPYANTWLANAHPEHYQCPNEGTFRFYDPAYPYYTSGSYRLVKPWKIVLNSPNTSGCIEVILEPRKTERGRPCPVTELSSKTKCSPKSQ